MGGRLIGMAGVVISHALNLPEFCSGLYRICLCKTILACLRVGWSSGARVGPLWRTSMHLGRPSLSSDPFRREKSAKARRKKNAKKSESAMRERERERERWSLFDLAAPVLGALLGDLQVRTLKHAALCNYLVHGG
jgi:hypothetical protein